MTIVFRALSFLPLFILHTFGAVLGWVVFVSSKTYRQRFMANATQAGLGSAEILPAVAAAGRLVAELPRLWMGRAVVIHWQGEQHVEQALQAGRGIVFLTPHLGCFEVTAQAYAQRYGLHGKPMTVLFRPPRKYWLGRLVGAARQRPGLYTAPASLAGVKQMLKALKNGECVGVLPDQVPPNHQGLWTPFFGKPAYTMTLSARLAQQTGATILIAWGERLAWGRGYTVHVAPLEALLLDDLGRATEQINHAMESLIAQCPTQYLWAYDRYKQPRD
jgi:KDO2-lipid IV(A) lauroyltransferase